MTRYSYDVLIVGGGIAGTSIGYHLAADRTVGLVEMENVLGYHTTGRSAAAFLESYGSHTIRLLVSSSRRFLEDPPEDFEGPLLHPRSLLWVVPEAEIGLLDQLEPTVREFVPDAKRIGGKEAVEQCPLLADDWVSQALIEPGASDIDVSAVHQGFIRGLRRRGGETHLGVRFGDATRKDGRWSITSASGDTYEAPVVVNAAGAWGDEMGRLVGAKPVGLYPRLRNVFMLAKPDLPPGYDFKELPLVFDVSQRFYFKPEGDSSLLCSPADELPSEPCDARPDTESIARALDDILTATRLESRHVTNSWAGLRTFVADRTPVACFDPEVEGFFWFVGQGGYGIETSPALSRAAASLLATGAVPDDLGARGLTPSDLDRSRLAGMTELQAH